MSVRLNIYYLHTPFVISKSYFEHFFIVFLEFGVMHIFGLAQSCDYNVYQITIKEPLEL